MTTPCYKCTERHQHCHSECEAYKEYVEARDKERMANYKANDTTGFIIRNKEKAQRRK